MRQLLLAHQRESGIPDVEGKARQIIGGGSLKLPAANPAVTKY